MIRLVFFCVPTLIYLIVQSRGAERTFRDARHPTGVAWGTPAAYGWSLLLLVPLALIGWLAIVLVPAEVLELPGVSIATLTSVGAIGIMLRAVSEEVFF